MTQYCMHNTHDIQALYCLSLSLREDMQKVGLEQGWWVLGGESGRKAVQVVKLHCALSSRNLYRFPGLV